jgi:eukaryotic-like serine/threonine-protein kinase
MPLPSGLRLGPYEIRSPLGVGGMGEVYEAVDTRLHRSVAIKIVRPELAGDAARRERFVREARSVAGLSHPNICPVYDVGEASVPGHAEPVDFLVMELLRGRNLAERLAEGPLPFDEAIAYGIQIASALACAHGQGIVHRDLKPANIMLAPSGARLLDFGLARLRADNSPLLAAPTRTSLTAEGTILGTIQYMAPEQLEGRQVDQRADIFAFGAILYEMVAGRPAFKADSTAGIISAILAGETPRLRHVAPLTPPALDHAVTTCLARNAEDRWWSAHDIALVLKSLGRPDHGAASPTPIARPWREPVAWALAALALALATLLWLRGPAPGPATAVPEALSVVPPAETTLTQGEAPQFSPDGRLLAIVGTDSAGRTQLYIRERDSAAWRTLPETDDAMMPFWSPDSQSLGFFSAGWLRTVAVSGGTPRRLAPAGVPRGGTWNQHGQILFVSAPNLPPQLIPAGGGEATSVPIDADGLPSRWFPAFLPDGQRYLYLGGTTDRRGRIIRAGSLDSPEAADIVPSEASATYASGHLLYRRDGSLVAQRFDAERLALHGDAQVVAERLAYNPISYQALYSTSTDGRLAYVGEERGWQLSWFDALGRETRLLTSAGGFNSLCVSADGSRVVYDFADPSTGAVDVWTLSLADGTRTPLTFDPAVDFYVACAPSGEEAAFSSLRRGVPHLFRTSLSAPGSATLLLPATEPNLVNDWSADGRHLLYSVIAAGTGWDIWALPLAGGEAFPVVRTSANERNARLSRDGRWVAYTSDQRGIDEIFVRSFPDTGSLWQISQGGARQAVWHPSGRRIFYVSRDLKLMAVDIESAGQALSRGATKVLAETRAGGFERASTPIAVAGDRVLLGTAREGGQPIPIVLNWNARLPAR